MSDLEFNAYQQKALKSVAIADKSVAALAHRTLGLTGEAGIVGNAMKKVIRDKQGTLDTSDLKLLKEKLGDTLYYIAVLADFAGIKLADIAEDNILKSEKFRNSR